MHEWPHLGHIITSTLDDGADIINRSKSLGRMINNVLCYFSTRNAVVKLKLFKAYCSSLYGCELWELEHPRIEDIEIAWRKGLRRVWGVRPDTHSVLLPSLSDCLPCFDELCRRSVKFINKCLNSDCAIVKFVSSNAVYHSRMRSPMGRNALFCCQRYGWSVHDILSLTSHTVTAAVVESVSDETKQSVSFLLELIFMRENSLGVSGFTVEQITDIINFVSRPEGRPI